MEVCCWQMTIFNSSITRQFASGKLSEQVWLDWNFLADTNYLAASAKNCANPLSVNGWFKRAIIAGKGAVITSEPNLAH